MRNMLRILVVAILFALGVAYPADAVNLPITPQQVTATAGNAATVTADAGIVTSASLSTASSTYATFVIACSAVTPSSIVLASVQNGTNTGGTPDVTSITPGNGVVTILIQNSTLVTAFNGTIKISFVVFN